MARLRSLLCASLLAAAHAAAETATCSDPLAASALPTPIVDAKALSDQARGRSSALAGSALTRACSHGADYEAVVYLRG